MDTNLGTKTCIGCGVEQPISCFRQYYNGRKGRYNHCKDCETIESRRKYLSRKTERSGAEQEELDNIQKLYDMRVVKGLRPPSRSNRPRTKAAALVAAALQDK